VDDNESRTIDSNVGGVSAAAFRPRLWQSFADAFV
jgi:hypothetical protein